jgi:hypothetical protein
MNTACRFSSVFKHRHAHLTLPLKTVSASAWSKSGISNRCDGARHLKKSDGVLRKACAVKYAFIRDHTPRWCIEVMCRVLETSVSGYRDFMRRPVAEEPARLLAHMLGKLVRPQLRLHLLRR